MGCANGLDPDVASLILLKPLWVLLSFAPACEMLDDLPVDVDVMLLRILSAPRLLHLSEAPTCHASFGSSVKYLAIDIAPAQLLRRSPDGHVTDKDAY